MMQYKNILKRNVRHNLRILITKKDFAQRYFELKILLLRFNIFYLLKRIEAK